MISIKEIDMGRFIRLWVFNLTSFFGEFKNHDFAFPFNDSEIQVINRSLQTSYMSQTTFLCTFIYQKIIINLKD
jgi:hypothetical protein